MNAIDADITAMLAEAVEEGKKNWRAIVVGNEAPDFCVGANLFLVLMGAKSGAWEQIDQGVARVAGRQHGAQVQRHAGRRRASGRALGGGAEIVMHGQKVRAAVETYIGLVEVGAGVIPAGGGCKELLARWQSLTPEQGPFPAVAPQLRDHRRRHRRHQRLRRDELRLHRQDDAVTWDRERLLADAKADALALAEAKDRGRGASRSRQRSGCRVRAGGSCWSRSRRA